MLGANNCRVVLTFQVKSFLQRSSSLSLASASHVKHDNESWHARQRVYLTNTYNLNSYDSRTRAWADVFTQKKKLFHDVARRSLLIFSIFLLQIPCTRLQSICKTTSQNAFSWPPRLEVRGLLHNTLHFPIIICVDQPTTVFDPGHRRQGRTLRANSSRLNFMWVHVQPGAVKLALQRQWMNVTQVHPVTTENHFHCTRL